MPRAGKGSQCYAMFAVSGPGILLLSVFFVPASALLYMLWKPKKPQLESDAPIQDAISLVSGGSLQQTKYEADDEADSRLMPLLEIDKTTSQEHAALELDDLGDTSLHTDQLEVDELALAAPDVGAFGLAGETPGFEKLTDFSDDASTQSIVDQNGETHIEILQESMTDDDTVEQLPEELDTETEIDNDASIPTVVAQHPMPPIPPAESSERAPTKAPRAKKVRNKMATFPFDVSVWDDPLSPRAMRRKQRKVERLEVAGKAERRRSVGRKDIAGDNATPVVLHYDVGVGKPAGDVFMDVWAQASGAEAPDEVGKLVTERGEARGRRKAERESRSLEKMTAARKKKEERDAQKKRNRGPVSGEAFALLDDAATGAGDGAVIEGAEIVQGEGVAFVEEGIEATELEIGTWDVDFEEEDGDGSGLKSGRGVKRAERESRALEKLTSRRRKADAKAGSVPQSSQGSEDLAADFTGAGADAVLAAGILETSGVSAWELAAQAEMVDPSKESEALTWESAVGSSAPGMGVEAVSAWDQAAESASLQGSVVEFGPQAITSSSDLLEMGAAIVIGDGPGTGGDAWFVPEGFDEYAEEPRRRTSRRRKRRGEEDEVEEAVGGGWTDGGVLVEADENIDFRAYDLPEPVPARASVMFGESE